jgi:hypothetical protein
VLARQIGSGLGISAALKAYEADRMPRYEKVRELSLAVENSADAREYAETYAVFSHWMRAERPGPADPTKRQNDPRLRAAAGAVAVRSSGRAPRRL